MMYRRADEEVYALRDVSFNLMPGERMAVTGASGSGKSTLLSLLGALDRPTQGSISVHGQNITQMSVEARSRYRHDHVGFVFQEFNLLGHLTCLENVLTPFLGRSSKLHAHRDRAMELLNEVGLGHLVHRSAGVLSGGEKQRVAVARAVVNDPDVILCDEPTGNLDYASGRAVMDLLDELACRRPKVNVVVVTHDMAIAERFPRTLHMHDGRLS